MQSLDSPSAPVRDFVDAGAFAAAIDPQTAQKLLDSDRSTLQKVQEHFPDFPSSVQGNREARQRRKFFISGIFQGLNDEAYVNRVRNFYGLPEWKDPQSRSPAPAPAPSPAPSPAPAPSTNKGTTATAEKKWPKQDIATDEPPLPTGHVRLYHGGSPYDGGKRWMTPNRQYAEGYAEKSGGVVSYVDVPNDHPQLEKSFDDEGTSSPAPITHFEADEETSGKLKPLLSPKPAPKPATNRGTAAPKQAPPVEREPEATTPQPQAPPPLTAEELRKKMEERMRKKAAAEAGEPYKTPTTDPPHVGESKNPPTPATDATARNAPLSPELPLDKSPPYVRDEINRQYELAKRRGLASKIEELAALGNTAQQIAKALAPNLPKDQVGELKDMVRSVRVKLGIPSLDDTTEFNAWRDSYNNKKATSAAKPAPGPRIEAAQDAVKEAEAKIEDIIERMKRKLRNPNVTSGLDPELVGMAAELGSQYVILGVRKFQVFVAKVQDAFGAEDTKRLLPSLRLAWETIKEDFGYDVDEPTGESITEEPAERPAVEPEVQSYGSAEKPDRIALGKWFDAQLSSGKDYDSILEARAEVEKLVGGKIVAGTPAAKDVDEAIEQGIVRTARRIVEEGGTDEEIFDKMVDLYERHPRLMVRTSTSATDQAFSTPAPLAWIANVTANVRAGDTTLDSSAGNGMLLIGPGSHIANELEKRRVASLRAQGIDAHEGDATKYTPDQKVDAVIINPPFGEQKDDDGDLKFWTVPGAKTRNGRDFVTSSLDHAIAARTLQNLKPNGRAVVILGAKGFETGKPKADRERSGSYSNSKAFYDHLWDNYNVVDHYTVAGDLYSKMGASFPVDVIVIDGVKPSVRPKPYNFKQGGLPHVYESWEDLKEDCLTRLAVSKSATGDVPAGPGMPGGSAPSQRPNPDMGSVPPKDGGQDSVDSEGTGSGRGGRSGQAGGTGMGGRGPAADSGPESTPAGGGLRPGGSAPEPDAGTGTAPGELPADGGTGPSGDRSGATAPGPGGVVPDATNTKRQSSVSDEETEFQSAYEPGSNSRGLGSLIPKSQADAVQRSLAKFKEKYGEIDDFVAKELGISEGTLTDYFSAEQLDGIALAIARHKEGRAFIIGDQTGVGKGRVAAAMILYAKRQGLLPIFCTHDAKLYADIVRDLTDIGLNSQGRPFVMAVTNALSGKTSVPLPEPDTRVLSQSLAQAESRVGQAVESFLATGKATAVMNAGEPAVEVDAIFTTYSQLQQYKKEFTARHIQLAKLGEKSFLIMDESHDAGGSEARPARPKPGEKTGVTRSQYVKALLRASGGAVFLSGTYAKRPSVLPLYEKTGIGAAFKNPDELEDAIKRGGIPLQQVVSEMLSEAGAFIRRERTFAGIEFAPKVVETDLQVADDLSSSYRNIAHFSEKFQDAMKKDGPLKDLIDDITSAGGKMGKDSSVRDASVTSTNFTSLLWNMVDQMVLAMKATQAADEAIAAWKAGESPLIAVDATMEAALDYYVTETGVKVGDVIDFSFKHLLKRYLDNCRTLLVKHDKSDPDSWERIYLTDEQIGEELLELYDSALAEIEEFEHDIPISPIDWIRNRMTAAGMKVAEITGRELMVDYSNPSLPVLAKRSKEETGSRGAIKTIKDFNDGNLDGAVLNRSGSVGISAHAREGIPNQRRRHMIIAQAAKNIDEFMQMLGRINRTGQIRYRRGPISNLRHGNALPKYTLLLSNIPAETRPASVLVRKLGSLNANVTASSKGNVSFDFPNVLNEVGDEVIANYLAENDDVNTITGGEVGVTKDGAPDYNPGVSQKVTGRVVLLPVARQQEFWDQVIESFNQEIEELDRLGKNPLSAKVLDLSAERIADEVIFPGEPGSDNPFAASAHLTTMMVNRIGTPMTSGEVKKAVDEFYGTGTAATRYGATQWSNTQIEKIREEIQRRASEQLARVAEDSPQAEKIKKDAQSRWNRCESVMRTCAPGTRVSIEEYGSLTTDIDGRPNSTPTHSFGGVIMRVTRRNGSKSMSALSQWVAEVALQSPERMLRIPLSRINPPIIKENSTVVVSSGTFAEASDYAAFDEPVDSREVRHIATGNLLAAFGELKTGSIVFYTDKNGKLNRGVLMPRSFDPKKRRDEAPVIFPTADHVFNFIRNVVGSVVGTPAKDLTINYLPSMAGGTFQFVIPVKSTQRAAKYAKNVGILRAASPDEFVQGGSSWILKTTDAKRAKKIIEAILKVTPLVTRSNKDEANKVIGNIPPTVSNRSVNSGTVQARKLTPASAADLPLETDDPTVAVRVEGLLRIVAQLKHEYGITIDRGRMGSSKNLGEYNTWTESIRMRKGHEGGIGTAAHELAHHLDKLHGLTASATSDVEDELKKNDYDPKKKRAFEGFAEFVRQWMVDDQASLAGRMPHTVDWWNRWLFANRKDAKKLRRIRKLMQDYVNGGPTARRRAGMATEADPTSVPIKTTASVMNFTTDAVRKCVRAFADELQPLALFTSTAKSRGKSYEADVGEISPEDAAHAVAHSAVRGSNMAFTGIWSPSGSKQYSPPLTEVIKTLNATPGSKDYEDFNHFVISRRMLEIQYEFKDYGGSWGWQDAVDSVNKVMTGDPARRDRFLQAAKELAAWNNGLAEWMRDMGGLDQESLDRMLAAWDEEAYVPMFRRVNGSPTLFDRLLGRKEGARQSGSTPFRRLSRKGSEAPTIDVFQATLIKAMNATSKAYRRQAELSLLDTIQDRSIEGLGGLAQIVRPEMEKIEIALHNMIGQLKELNVVTPHDHDIIVAVNRIRQGDTSRISNRMIETLGDEFWIYVDVKDPVSVDDLFKELADMHGVAGDVPDLMSKVSWWKPVYEESPAERIVVMRDRSGKPVLVQMEQSLYNLMSRSWTPPSSALAIQAARLWALGQRTGAIVLKPSFWTQNPVRDLPGGLYNARERLATVGNIVTQILKLPVTLTKALVNATAPELAKKTLTLATFGKVSPEAADRFITGPCWELYQESGVTGGHHGGTSARALEEQVMLLYDMNLPRRLARYARRGHIVSAVRDAIGTITEIPAATEAMHRFDAFEWSLRNDGFTANPKSTGKNDRWVHKDGSGNLSIVPRPTEQALMRAAMSAREIGPDFQRSGSLKHTFGPLFGTFFFAGVAGIEQERRNLMDIIESIQSPNDDRRRRAWKRVAMLAMADIIRAAVYWYFVHDKDWYKEKGDRERNTYFYLPWSDGGEKIHKGYNYGAIPNIVESVLNAVEKANEGDGKKAAEQLIGEDLLQIVYQHLPMGDPLTAASSVPVLGTMMDVTRNKQWDNRTPIVPANLQGLSKELQSRDDSTTVAKNVSAMMPESGRLSPLEIDYTINQASGGLWRMGSTTYDAASKGKLAEAGKRMFVSGFEEATNRSISRNEVYDRLKQVDTKINDAHHLEKRPDPAIVAERKELKAATDAIGALSKLNRGKATRQEKFPIDSLIIGTSRAALKKPALESYPDALHKDTDLAPYDAMVEAGQVKPSEIRRKEVLDRVPALSFEKPDTVTPLEKAKGVTLGDKIRDWDDNRRAAAVWLREKGWTEADVADFYRKTQHSPGKVRDQSSQRRLNERIGRVRKTFRTGSGGS